MKNNKQPSFDAAAALYDDVFTNSHIGKMQRKRVYYWLDKVGFFKKQRKVFEVNCGTGFDAEEFLKKGHKVVATDASAGMIEVAKEKRDPSIQFYQLTFEEVQQDERFQNSEALFSNFWRTKLFE